MNEHDFSVKVIIKLVCGDAGGACPRNEDNSLNLSKANAPFLLSFYQTSIRGWKGQRYTFPEPVWSVNCTDSLDQQLLSVSSWVFFLFYSRSLTPFQHFIQILILDYVNSAGSREHRSNLERLQTDNKRDVAELSLRTGFTPIHNKHHFANTTLH